MVKLYTILIIGFLLVLNGCSQQQSANSLDSTSPNTLTGKLIITGSSTIAPLAAELALQFEKKNRNSKIDVQTGGSSRGIADIRQGTSHIGMVSRQLKLAENDLKAHLLAKDGVSIIVHKNNPIRELSESQIRSIYLGKIDNWKSLNGVNQKITVINKSEGRSTLEVFAKYFKLKNSQIKSNIIIGDNEQAVKLVSKNPHAIAYVSIGTAEYDIALGIPIKTLPLNGVPANTATLLKNQFPLSRELNFITKEQMSALAIAFINYAQSKTANSIIEGFGFVPTHP